jgi:anti-sigma factor RsiW
MNSQTHLTHKQLCDLVIESPLSPEDAASDEVHSHLHSCYTCMAELTALTSSIDQFHTVAHTVPEREFTAHSRPGLSGLSMFVTRRPAVRWMQPLSFALAAALLVAVGLPLTLTHHHAAPLPPQEQISKVTAPVDAVSNEALLEGVDQDLSDSIPDSMQPLADPTASAATSSSTQRTN